MRGGPLVAKYIMCWSRTACSARFDLEGGGLAERRMFDEEMNVGRSAAQDRCALPAAAGKNEIDHDFEIRPVEFGNHAFS